MIDKNLVLVAARHTPTALKEPCVWQHQTAESVSDLPQDERVFAGDLCVFAASDGTKTAFRYEHYWECDGEKKFDVYAPEVISENGTVAFTKDGEELEELTYGDTVTVTVIADEGYQVKTITLNGEEIENGAEITVDGDILLIAEFEESPAPSGTVLIPVGDYTTSGDGDPSHGIYYNFEEISEDTYQAYIDAMGDELENVENVKHTITIDGETLENKVANIEPSFGFLYFGNLSLNPMFPDAEDTGEDWCFGIAGALGVFTRTATTVNFGVSYTVEAPSGVYEWDGELDGSEVESGDAYKFHLIPNSTFISKEDIIGATVTGSIIGETPFVVTADDIEDYTEGCYAIETSLDTVIVIGSFAEYGFVTDGVYFAKLISDGKYVSKLTLAE